MATKDSMFMYSPPLLTEDGVFEVSCDSGKCIRKESGILTIIDSISLAVIEEFSTYPEAKEVKFSRNAKFFAFIDQKCPVTLKIIELDSGKVYTVETEPNFMIKYIKWSINSKFLVFFSDLDLFIGVYKVGGNKIILEGSDSDEFNQPLCAFNPDQDYFSVLRHDNLFTYCTETWDIHSTIRCPVNSVGFIFIDIYSVAVWTSSGRFEALSLLGEVIFAMTSFLSRIKSVKLCHENRVLAIATYDDKVELFDVLSWEKFYSFDYPLELNNIRPVVWSEVGQSLQFEENRSFTDSEFERKTSLILSSVKNICDEFKLKTSCKFLLSFSNGNKFLASYSPGIPNVVWIRNLRTGQLAGIVSMIDGVMIRGLKWHPNLEILAILTNDSVVFWMETNTVAIYCKSLLSSFHWVNTKLTICGIGSEKECVFVYFNKR